MPAQSGLGSVIWAKRMVWEAEEGSHGRAPHSRVCDGEGGAELGAETGAQSAGLRAAREDLVRLGKEVEFYPESRAT